MRFSRKNFIFLIIFPHPPSFFPKIPPQTLDKQEISLYHPPSILSGWLVSVYQPWNWSVKIVSWRKKSWLVLRNFLD